MQETIVDLPGSLCSFYLNVQVSGGGTYAGVTPKHPTSHRLKHHNAPANHRANREVGSRRCFQKNRSYTNKRGPYKHVCFLYGFQNERQSLQYEWKLKQYSKRKKDADGILLPRDPRGYGKGRVQGMIDVLKMDRWTKKADPSAGIPLTLYIFQWDWFINIDLDSLPSHITCVWVDRDAHVRRKDAMSEKLFKMLCNLP